MKRKLLLLLSIFALCGCSAAEDTSLSEITVSPTVSPSPSPTPSLSRVDDDVLSCSYDDSLLQYVNLEPDSSFKYGTLFASVDFGVELSSENYSCVYVCVISCDSKLIDEFQNNTEMCVSSLFTKLFGTPSSSEYFIDCSDGVYEYRTSFDGYKYSGKLLDFGENSYTILVRHVSESEGSELVYALNNVYDTITLKDDYSKSFEFIPTEKPSDPTFEPTVTPPPTNAPEVSELFTTVYLPYAKRNKLWGFNPVKSFVQTCGYTSEIIEPTDDSNGSITVSDSNGDYVYFYFIQNQETGMYNIMSVGFYRASTNSEVSVSNYSSDGSRYYDKFGTHVIGESTNYVQSTDEQQSFLFQ